MMQTIQIRLTKELVEQIKSLVDKGVYPNSSECVRDAVRRLITGAGGKLDIPEAIKVQEKLQAQIKESFQRPTGTLDFYPDEMSIRNQIFLSLRKTAKNFNFNEIETPAFETLDLLKKKSGDEILTQIFTLEKKGEEQFGLRFDLTIPITRMFLEKQKEIPKPVKWFGLSRMWRYERPQAGRLREFYQLSVEMFGSDKPDADAEIINLAISCLTNLGLSEKDFVVKINNRKLLQGLLEDVSKDKVPQLMKLIDKKSKITEDEFERELKNIKIDPEKINNILECATLEDVETLNLNDLAKQGLEELKSIFSLLDNNYILFDISTARGLAYYTGTVFEIFDRENKFRAIAGGGRYDNLVELYGGAPSPATGFGMGYSTLSLLLKEKDLLPKPKTNPDYFVIIIGQENKKKSLEIISKLRKKFRVDYDLNERNIKKQMNYADSIKAAKVIFIGETELKEEMLTIKDMKTGAQEKVGIDLLTKN